MKRIKITAICISLLATLSMVGCIATPGFYSGMPHFSYGPHFSHGFGHGFTYGPGGVVFDDPCGPCGQEMACGPEMICGPAVACSVVVKSSGPPRFPQRGTIVDCRTALSNIGKGVLMVGRGVLDITATPFVVVGNLLSSGCRFEVLTHCPGTHIVGHSYQIIDSCCSTSTSGCDTCHNGFIESGFMRSIQPDIGTHSRTTISSPMPRRSSSVIQAAHVEPTTPGVRFVQPR
jgi:hypothetical protein